MRALITTLVTIAIIALAGSPALAQAKKPNILVIFGDWKLSFATAKGNIATGVREVSAWALITNLRMDPYERGLDEGGGAIDFLARNIWLLVPIQQKVKEFFADYEQFPHQEGSSLNAGGIGYGLLRQAEAMKRLKDLESLTPR